MLSLGGKLFWLIVLKSDLIVELMQSQVSIDKNVMFCSHVLIVKVDLGGKEKKFLQWTPVAVDSNYSS